MVILQRANVERFVPHRADGADGGGGAGERGDAGDTEYGRDVPQRPVVENRLATKGGVDHQVDLAILEAVTNVRATFVHLVHNLNVEAVSLEVGRRAAGAEK